MSVQCGECGEQTIWDQDIGSSICTHCGTLTDPSQSVLASHLEHEDSARELSSLWNTSHGNTLKGRNGWALAGQGKEARDLKNTIAMHEFIKSIATRLSKPGVTPRAQALFDQAMQKGRYRWGRKATLTAGASIAIAFRESHRSDSIRDIACLLDVPPISLSRAFTSLTSLLELTLTSADPTQHLSTLFTHLRSLISSSLSLPAPLRTALTPLLSRLTTITHTATALSDLLARTAALNHLPTIPTACALVILALEAELAASLPHAGAFAQALGARMGVGKGVVMQRYKIIYDIIEEWIREVPWLQAHERKETGAKGRGQGRSKVAKRVVVARGLKDVVQFQADIWRKKFEMDRPEVFLEFDSECDAEDLDGGVNEHDVTHVDPMVLPRASPITPSATLGAPPARKRRKTRYVQDVEQATLFLLHPQSTVPNTVAASDILAHLLTAEDSALPHAFSCAPTRLQLIAAGRGDDVPDEELFAEGEMEGLMRSEQEQQVLRATMDWAGDSSDAGPELNTSGAPSRKRKRTIRDDGTCEAGKSKGTSRIDMNALARLMDPSASIDAAQDGSEDGVEEDDMDEVYVHDDGLVEEDWRPMSPGGGVFDDGWFDF